MKKTLTVLLVALVLALAIVPVLAAAKDDYQKKMVEIRLQQIELQKQAVQAQVQAGYLTKEQGDWMISQLDLQKKFISENPSAVFGHGFGGGMMRRGFGPGAGVGGGCGNCPFNGQAPAPNANSNSTTSL